jgi:hypothetical protein
MRLLLLAALVASCAPPEDGCEPSGEAHPLHDDVREASGLALSRAHRNVLWTHNDSNGGAAIFAIDTDGAALGRIELAGAHNRDWEDIAVGACPGGGPGGDCVFVADIGDNRAAREGVGIWIAAEPDPSVNGTAQAVFLRLHYPDGARDAEAIVALDDGSLLIVTKGREHPVTVYRSPKLAWPAADSTPLQLTRVQELSAEPVDLPRQVTGASGRDGLIAVRSYARLQFFRFDGDTLAAILPEPAQLDSLAEPQGEGIALGARGRAWLVSEAGPQAIAPRLTPIRCRLP